jgi:tetratricopeptide (TPR) repeat protein
MVYMSRITLFFALTCLLATPGLSAQSNRTNSSASRITLNQYIEKLKKNPANNALRKKIFSLALTMKPAPTVPVKVERNMTRGAAFARKAAGASGYNKAIAEYEAATNSAPWLAIAYYNLGVLQEKVGYYTEAVRNFNWYLMAAPKAKNARAVKNTVYALETELGANRSSVTPNSPAPTVAPAAKKMTLSIKQQKKKQQRVVHVPPPAKKKPKKPSFIGNWFYKDTVRGKERVIQAFRINKGANGGMIAVAPKRAAAYVSTIRDFTRDDTTMKLAIHWRMTSVVGYWKIERYELTLSKDGKTMTGSYSAKSVGGRNIALTKTLFRRKEP